MTGPRVDRRTCARLESRTRWGIMSAEKPEVAAGTGKRRLIANIVLVAVWAYVAMIYLLAFDQQFRWGIF